MRYLQVYKCLKFDQNQFLLLHVLILIWYEKYEYLEGGTLGYLQWVPCYFLKI